MAVTFKIPNSGERSQTYMDAQSTDRSRGLGEQRVQPLNLPKEDIRGNVSAILRTGESTARMLGQFGDLANAAGEYLNRHLEVEDNVRAEEVQNKMRIARVNVQKTNTERAERGEISFGQIADENQKALEFEYNNIIESTPFNYSSVKDTLKVRAETDRTQIYAEDTNAFVKLNTQKAIKTYESSLHVVGQTMLDGIGEYQKGAQELESLKLHPMYQLNPSAYDEEITAIKQQAAKTHLTLLAKTNPAEYKRLRSDGTLDSAFGGVIPKSSFDMFDVDADETELQLANRGESEFNQRSTEISYEYMLGMQNGDILTEAEIMENVDLTDAHKIHLLGKVQAVRDKEHKIQQQREYMRAITLDGTTGVNLEENDVDEYYIQNGGIRTNSEVLNNPANTIDIIDQNYEFYGGRLPKPLLNALRAGPPKSKDESVKEAWGKAIRHITASYPEVAKKLPDSQIAAALILENQPDVSYQDAINTFQQRTAKYNEDVESKKHFDDSKMLKDSPYRDPDSFILKQMGVEDKAIPDALRANFLLNYRKLSQLMPEATPEVLATKALKDTNFDVAHIGSKRVMLNPPSVVYEGPALQQFDRNFLRIVKEVNINREAMGQATLDEDQITIIRHPEDAKGFLLQETESGKILYDDNHRPISINSDKSEYELNDERLKRGGTQIERRYRQDSKNIKESQQLLSSIEKSYSSLTRFPGILDAIWATESSRGQNMLSGAGAKGHFQFMDGTAQDMGVQDVNNLEDSGKGAAKYMDMLLEKYNGNINNALAAYNWGMGNVDDWLERGGDNKKLPKETRDYIIKVSKTMNHNTYLRNSRESVIQFRKRS
jgi:hypothetical protein